MMMFFFSLERLSHAVEKKHSFSEHVVSSTTQQNEVGNLIDEETVAIGRVK